MNKIGIIAEDNSDVSVLKYLIQKIGPDKTFSLKKFVGYGCGKIIGKGLQWAKNLKDQGCTLLVVVHDLDRRDLRQLSTELDEAFKPSPIKKNVIVIPVREIEAWLLSDNLAIQQGLKLPILPSFISNPEDILDAKRKLREIVYISSNKKKRYINTIHNEHIASCIDLKNIRRCSSFQPLESFLLNNMR